MNAPTYHISTWFTIYFLSVSQDPWRLKELKKEWRDSGLLHTQTEMKPQSPKSLLLCFAARWCWQVFLHCLTGNAHPFLVQDVLWEKMILLPRAEQTCILATVTLPCTSLSDHIHGPLQSISWHRERCIRPTGSSSRGFTSKREPTLFHSHTQCAHLYSLFLGNGVLVRFPRTPDSFKDYKINFQQLSC